MIIKAASFLLQLIAVIGGVFLGLALKGGPPAASYDAGAPADAGSGAEAGADDQHAKSAKKDGKDKKAKDDKSGKAGKDSAEEENYVYIRFGRQFIVPVVQTDGSNALVVLDINLEVTPSASETAYQQEPKVRDALLSTLLELSTEGAFNASFTDQENLEAIRTRLLTAARQVLKDDVHGVLILSIARQSF